MKKISKLKKKEDVFQLLIISNLNFFRHRLKKRNEQNYSSILPNI